MTLTLLTGFQNEGKTLAGCRFAFENWLAGRKILTNTSFAFSHELINRDFLLNLIEQGISLKNVTYFLDEFWLWADARMRNSFTTMLSYFYLQSSKDNANIIMTAQTDRQIDIRLRENLHYWGECRRFFLYKNKLCKIPTKLFDKRTELPDFIKNNIIIEVKMHKPVSRISIRLSYDDFKIVKKYYIFAPLFYNMYNTEAKIKTSFQKV